MLRAHIGRLRVHQAAVELAAWVLDLARQLRGPGALKHGDQLVRAALSVPSNIAEACGRATVGEFRQFLGYARGSAKELLSQIGVTRRVEPKLTKQCRTIEDRCVAVLKQLNRLYDNPPPER
ncbi:MAG TPA: four helix bundle protein [Gemmatimonadales bacterium]|nr:four helix bundle protein [Gemmatimonadales bacterium]